MICSFFCPVHWQRSLLQTVVAVDCAQPIYKWCISAALSKDKHLQVESLELARDSAAANHKRELAAAQRDAAQVAAQHKSAAASWHTDLDTYKSEVRTAVAINLFQNPAHSSIPCESGRCQIGL